MKMITFIGLLFPLLYTGCGDNEIESLESSSLNTYNNDINMSKNMIEKDFLRKLGLDIKNEKITIDINKTTNFFKKMKIEMHGKADALQHKIEKADIDFSRDIGIDFSDEKVEIDLNQTRKMFQQINILMKEVLLDRNSSKD